MPSISAGCRDRTIAIGVVGAMPILIATLFAGEGESSLVAGSRRLKLTCMILVASCSLVEIELVWGFPNIGIKTSSRCSAIEATIARDKRRGIRRYCLYVIVPGSPDVPLPAKTSSIC